MSNIGQENTYGFFSKQVIPADGIEVSFVLDFNIGTDTSILVIDENGAIMEPGAGKDYSIGDGGRTLLFTSPPNAGTYVFFLGKEISTSVPAGSYPIIAQITNTISAVIDLSSYLATETRLISSGLIVFKNQGLLRVGPSEDYTVNEETKELTLAVAPIVTDEFDIYIYGIQRRDITELDGWRSDGNMNLIPRFGPRSLGRVDSPIGDIFCAGNATIAGNLQVLGEETILNTTTLEVEDNEIVLNSTLEAPASAPSVSGIEILRGSTGPNSYMRWDESGAPGPNWTCGEVGDIQRILRQEDYDALDGALDTHAADTSNPHSVTNSQVGLGNVTNDAQLKRAAGDLITFSFKGNSEGDDVVLIEDSSDAYNKKALYIKNIDHGDLNGVGTNSHGTIDSHLASTSNPHSVTKSQVGLGDVTNDAALKRADADFITFDEKTYSQPGDYFLIESSFNPSWEKKRIKFSNIDHDQLTNASGLVNNHAAIDTHIDSSPEVHRTINDAGTSVTNLWSASKIISHSLARSGNDWGVFTTVSPVAGDRILIEDADDSFEKKYITIGSIKHTDLDIIGSNSHADIDSHISNTSNPHSVDKNDVALGNVTNDLQLKKAAEWSGFPTKTPTGTDLFLIEDSASSNVKTRITLADIGLALGTGVSSFKSRTGAVVPQSNDYTWAQIDKTVSDIADLTTKSHTSLSDKGTNTHDQIDTHLADATKHRLINDAGTSATDLFSASEIISRLSGKVSTTGNESIGGDKTFTNNVVVDGNFTVNGTQTVLNTTVLDVEDNAITLNSGFTSGTPTASVGIDARRGDESTAQLRFIETGQFWACGTQALGLQEIIRRAEFDSHANSTSNPHSVDKSDVGLSNVTNDAQLKRTAGDIATFSTKGTPGGSDYILIEDAADSNNKKKVTIGSVVGIGSGGIPTGVVQAFAGTSEPIGYFFCDGAVKSKTTYPDLFAVIGYTYGGSGDDFNMPDMRQRFPMGKADAGTGSALGGTGGAIDHVHGLTPHTHNIASHTHSYSHTHQIAGHYHSKGSLAIGSSGGHSHTITVNTNNFSTGSQSANHYHSISHNHGSFTSGGSSSTSHSHTIATSTAVNNTNHHHRIEHMARESDFVQNAAFGVNCQAWSSGAQVWACGYTFTAGNGSGGAILTDIQGDNHYHSHNHGGTGSASASHTHSIDPPSYSGNSGNNSHSHSHTANHGHTASSASANHSHTNANFSGSVGNTSGSNGDNNLTTTSQSTSTSGGTGLTTDTNSPANTGGGNPPYLVLNYIIKY